MQDRAEIAPPRTPEEFLETIGVDAAEAKYNRFINKLRNFNAGNEVALAKEGYIIFTETRDWADKTIKYIMDFKEENKGIFLDDKLDRAIDHVMAIRIACSQLLAEAPYSTIKAQSN